MKSLRDEEDELNNSWKKEVTITKKQQSNLSFKDRLKDVEQIIEEEYINLNQSNMKIEIDNQGITITSIVKIQVEGWWVENNG